MKKYVGLTILALWKETTYRPWKAFRRAEILWDRECRNSYLCRVNRQKRTGCINMQQMKWIIRHGFHCSMPDDLGFTLSLIIVCWQRCSGRVSVAPSASSTDRGLLPESSRIRHRIDSNKHICRHWGHCSLCLPWLPHWKSSIRWMNRWESPMLQFLLSQISLWPASLQW